MKRIAFASDLHQYPDDYEPPSIEHPDPEVMRLAKILMDASPDVNGWDYSVKGATQGSAYHEEPYRHQIRMYIDLAETVLKEWQPATT